MGTRKTPHPAIPDPDEHNTLDVLKAVKESLEIGRTDNRGDPLDNWLTVRDLQDVGLIQYIDNSTVNSGGVGPGLDINNPVPLDPIGGPPGYNGPFLEPRDPFIIRPMPGRPTNVRTASLWDAIMVKWDLPTEGGNIDWLGAIVWVSNTPVFSQGALAGYASSNFYIHENIGLSTEQPQGNNAGPGIRYFWVAWYGRSFDDSPESEWTPLTGVKNQSEWTPHYYQPGVKGSASIDPEYVLNVLKDQITETEIYSSLNERINLIDYDSEGNQYLTPVQDRILAATENIESDVYAAIAEYAGVNQSENELRGEFNIRIDLNGYIVGFGLSALANIDQSNVTWGETSAFLVKADTFAVAFPGEDPVIPFVVGTVDGNPTVGIDGQLVVDGSITANSILANTIGASEINAESVWAGIVTAERIFSSTFATGQSPQTRVEINGVGTDQERFPFWYGWGVTSGISIEDVSTPFFWVDDYGTVKLAGDLYVTGTGRFWLGSNDTGDYRLEIGGYNDNIMFWAGRTQWPNRSIDPNSDEWIFYIDKFGNAKFRGIVEAEYVSGEFTQVVSINEFVGVTITTLATGSAAEDYAPVWPTEYELLAEWVLPAPPFNNPDVDLKPGHVPYLQLQFEMYGLGVDAGTVAIEWDSGNGVWVRLADSAYNILEYGSYFQIFASAPNRIYGACRFRMWAGGRRNELPTFGNLVGLLMGIR